MRELPLRKNDAPLDITIIADVISKKNAYASGRGGRRFKPKKVVDAENDALLQIPSEYFGLELVHPAVEFKAYLPKKSWAMDRDGAWTTILDYLVKAKVIKDDNVRHFNAPVYLHPVEEAAEKKFRIRIYPNGELKISDDL
jgi:Holliday junction resolvase RusA-like endonuclease